MFELQDKCVNKNFVHLFVKHNRYSTKFAVQTLSRF